MDLPRVPGAGRGAQPRQKLRNQTRQGGEPVSKQHRHEWTHQPEGIETEQWACIECEAVCASCIVTDTKRGLHPTGTALLICEGCLDYERRVVDDIADALGHWQHQPRSLVPAIRYDRDPSDGGGDGPRDGIAHPLDVIEVLWSWAEMFAEGTSRTLDDHDHAGEVIKGALMWAAHNPDASAW